MAFHVVLEAGDGDDVEAAARCEVGVGVMQEDGKEFRADFGRNVRDDKVKFEIGRYGIEAVGEVGLGVGEVVESGVLAGVVNGYKVFVDQVNVALGCEFGESEAERPIAAAEVEDGGVGGDIDVIEEERGAFVDLLGAKEAPSGMEGEIMAAQPGGEGDVLFELRDGQGLLFGLFRSLFGRSFFGGWFFGRSLGGRRLFGRGLGRGGLLTGALGGLGFGRNGFGAAGLGDRVG
jgi:hypothetical protein